MKFILIVIFLSLVNCKVLTDEKNQYKLEQVQVLFRHGDRIPQVDEIYKTDPYDSIYKEYGYGQLTKAGMQREYELGQILMKRYGKFLGKYKTEDVFAFSTDTDRTKMSLQLVLAGLYPPIENDIWNEKIHWSPIPTHYESSYTNFLRGFECPLYETLLTELRESPETFKKVSKFENFYEYLRNVTQITIENPFSPSILYNNLRAALSMDLPLPDWCSEDDYKKLEEIDAIDLDVMSSTELLKRIMVGPIVEQFLKNLKDTNDNRKIYLYAGHDLNIAAFTRSHNITNVPPVPDYGSALILEKLRGKHNKIHVRFHLWTGVSKEWLSLKLDKCNKMCPLSIYEQIVESLMPDDFSQKCRTTFHCESRRISRKKLNSNSIIPFLRAGNDLHSFKYT